MRLAPYLFVFVLWVSAFYASSMMAYAEFISLWYMPAGIALGAYLVLGKRAFVPVLLANWVVGFNFLDQVQNGFDPTHLATSLLFALAHAIAYGLGGLSARYWLSHFAQKNIPTKMVGLLAIYSVSALLAALSGLLVWELATEEYEDIIANSWFAWWLGDLIGVMILAPLMTIILPRVAGIRLRWLDVFFEHDKQLGQSHKSFVAKLLIAIATVFAVMIVDHFIDHPGVAYFIFLVVIPQLWIVFTERTKFAAFALFLVTTLIALGVGLFNVTDQAITYQFALYMTAATAYLGVSVPALLRENQALRELAMLDTLTQLPTKWLFQTLVNQVVKSSRPNQSHCIALFNLDNFSAINHDYGEAIGDDVLSETAKTITKMLRDSEILCRDHADTFILFLPNLDSEQAYQRANELRHCFPTLQYEDVSFPIRASFGVVQLQLGEELEHALVAASAALQQAKQDGKNKVVLNHI